MNKILWSPDPSNISKSKMTSFIKFINQKYGLSFKDYSDLYNWSIKNIKEFWTEIWNFNDIIYSKKRN